MNYPDTSRAARLAAQEAAIAQCRETGQPVADGYGCIWMPSGPDRAVTMTICDTKATPLTVRQPYRG